MFKLKLWNAFVLLTMHFVVLVSMYVNTNEYSTNWLLVAFSWISMLSMPLIYYDLMKYWSNIEALKLMFVKNQLNSVTHTMLFIMPCFSGLIFFWFGEQPYHKTMSILFCVPGIVNLLALGLYNYKLDNTYEK